MLPEGAEDPPPLPVPVEEPPEVHLELLPDTTHTVVYPSAVEGSVDVELRFHGVGGLHRTFFSDADAVSALGRALGPCVVQTAQVVVSYDQETRIGRIVLKVPPDGLRCLPRAAGDAVDLSPLEPVGVALASYRDALAGGYDYRLASFRVGVTATRGARSCSLWLAGDHPPDGRRWSPCVTVPTGELCAEGSAEEGITVLVMPDRHGRDYVRACLSR